jgi:hypothetical protein
MWQTVALLNTVAVLEVHCPVLTTATLTATDGHRRRIYTDQDDTILM